MIAIFFSILINTGLAAELFAVSSSFSFFPAMFQSVGALQSLAGAASAVVPVLILMLVIFLSVGLPLLIFIPLIKDWRKNQYLLRHGDRAQARILKIWDTGVSLNDNPQVGVLLEVHAPNRPIFRAETKSIVSRLQIPLVQVGSSVEVTFDPQDPSRIALVI